MTKNMLFSLLTVMSAYFEMLSQTTYYYLSVNNGFLTEITVPPQSNWNKTLTWDLVSINPVHIKTYDINFPPEISYNSWYFDAVEEALDDWGWALFQFNYELHTGTYTGPNVGIAFLKEPHFGPGQENIGGAALEAVTDDHRIVYSDVNSISQFTSSEIWLNNSDAFRNAGHRWTDIYIINNNELQVQSVLRHELGHILGLAHNPYSYSIMYNVYYFGSDKYLDAYDEEAVQNLYFNWQPPTSISEGLSYIVSFNLFQNYPNPFNPTTTIKFNLPVRQHASINIFNPVGQHIKTLVNGERNAGRHIVKWDGTNGEGTPVGSGTYIYQLKTPNFTDTKKMILLR